MAEKLEIENATLPEGHDGEEEMINLECSECQHGATLKFESNYRNKTSDLILRGTVMCTKDGHEWPISVKTNDITLSTEQEMPVLESQQLGGNVPLGLIEDIEQAEQAHFARVYKASVIVCRRAVQLGLAAPPHNIPDRNFAAMIVDAQAIAPPVLSARGFIHLEGVKEYADIGAHRTEEITAMDSRAAIFSAVNVLKELFP